MDPRLRRIGQKAMLDLPLPPFAAIFVSAKTRRNQKAKERRAKRIEDIRNRPDSDNYKMVHLIRCGRKCLQRSNKLAAQARWSMDQAVANNNDPIYLQRHNNLQNRSDLLKSRSNTFFKKANCQ